MQYRPSRTLTSPEARSGAVLVETAMVMPFFIMLLLGMMEFGHAYLVISTLNAAAKRGARMGASEGVTTQQVRDRISEILAAGIDSSSPNLKVYVKDASIFDGPTVDPTSVNYAGLPEIELEDAETSDLYLVRIEIPYNDVSIMPPIWVTNVTLHCQSVMRHE